MSVDRGMRWVEASGSDGERRSLADTQALAAFTGRHPFTVRRHLQPAAADDKGHLYDVEAAMAELASRTDPVLVAGSFQAARAAGVKPATVRSWVRRGRLRSYASEDGKPLYDVADLRELGE